MGLSFFDLAVSIAPPSGHFEPMPLTLGPNWQPNDIRVLIVSAAGVASTGETQMIPMTPDPPTGFTAAHNLTPDQETEGVFWRRLAAGDTDTNVSWPKPPGWRYFFWTTFTVRGVDPTSTPTAGLFFVSYTVGDANVSTASVTVPAAGTMVLSLGTITDVGQSWPSWSASIGVPTGWKHLVATDKSGTGFEPDANLHLMAVGKSFASAGSTGAVSVPIAVGGSPAFSAHYVFLRPAQDVTIPVGAA